MPIESDALVLEKPIKKRTRRQLFITNPLERILWHVSNANATQALNASPLELISPPHFETSFVLTSQVVQLQFGVSQKVSELDG